MADLKLLKYGSFSALAWDGRNKLVAGYDEKDETTWVFDAADWHGKYSVAVKPSSMCFDVYGRLLACDKSEKALVRNDYYGLLSFAGEFAGSPTEPQSVLIHSSGTYFLLGSKRLFHVIPEGRGVLDACDFKDLDYRGMCLSKDEGGLIFIRRDNKRLVQTEFDSCGKPLRERVLVFGTEFGDDVPHEVITDDNGNIYCAAGDKLYIFNEYGRGLGTIRCGKIGGMCYAHGYAVLYLSLADGIYGMEVNG